VFLLVTHGVELRSYTMLQSDLTAGPVAIDRLRVKLMVAYRAFSSTVLQSTAKRMWHTVTPQSEIGSTASIYSRICRAIATLQRRTI